MKRITFVVTALGVSILSSCDRGALLSPAAESEPVARALVPAAITLVDLGTLGGAFNRGTGINNSGQVVGSSATASGEVHAFLWDGAMTDLGTLGGTFSVANDINDTTA